MRTFNTEELNTVINNHMHWLKQDCDNWQLMKADLSGANLSSVNLRNVNLNSADLSYADLRDVNLRNVNLNSADLRGANLSGANLSGADLSYADIRGANLRDADLSYADLSGVNLRNVNLNSADLSGANLRDADLSYADLSYADLSGANLSGANLRDANLSGVNLRNVNLNSANLSNSKHVPYISMICPEEGSFIGWKKAKVITEELMHDVIVKLSILEDAKRSSATTRNCRCNKAKVLEIYNIDGTIAEERKCYSDFDKGFVYEVGKIVKVDDFNDNRWIECTSGIHFFINRQEAINY